MLLFTGERLVPQAQNVPASSVRRLLQEHLPRYIFSSEFASGRAILDVGSGSGYGAALLKRSGAESVDGVEISEEAVEHARNFYGEEGVTFHVADARRFNLNRTFDLAVCFELIEHVAEQNDVIYCIKKHLRKNGILVISTPRPTPEWNNEFHVREINIKEFISLLSPHFLFIRESYEDNLMISLLHDGNISLRDTLEEVVVERKERGQNDFVILIASDDEAILKLPLKPVSVINNEDYLSRVENDNRILYKAEQDLQHDKRVLSDCVEQLQKECDESRRQHVAVTAGKQALELEFNRLRVEHDKVNMGLSILRTDKDKAELELNLLRSEFDAFRHQWPVRIARLATRMPSARRVVERLRPSAPSVRHVAAPPIMAISSPWRLKASREVGRSLNRVDFLVGCPEGESQRYRVDNVLEALALRGVSGRALLEEEIAEYLNGEPPDVLVLFRARYTEALGSLIDAAQSREIPLVFDVDDLVFEPESLNYIGAVRQLEESQKDFHLREIMAFKKTLEQCDCATATTQFLASRLEALGKKAYVLPNTINRWQIRKAFDLNIEKSRTDARVHIGYFSGSPTHNVDFEQASEALFNVLREYDTVTFHLVGALELPSYFKELEKRIVRNDFMPYLDMLKYLSGMDLVIAPLELGNPFAAGKSELKIFEAALVKVPCVASAVDSYSRCIANGINGFLVTNPHDWHEALRLLVTDSGLRGRVGQKAYDDLVSRFYFAERADDFKEIVDKGVIRNIWVRPQENPG